MTQAGPIRVAHDWLAPLSCGPVALLTTPLNCLLAGGGCYSQMPSQAASGPAGLLQAHHHHHPTGLTHTE